MEAGVVVPSSAALYLSSSGVFALANFALQLVAWHVYESNLRFLRWIPGKVMEEFSFFPKENEVMHKLPYKVGLT